MKLRRLPRMNAPLLRHISLGSIGQYLARRVHYAYAEGVCGALDTQTQHDNTTNPNHAYRWRRIYNYR